MKIVQTILAQIGNISKPQQNFLLVLFSTIFIVWGKVNFTNLSRYSHFSEKTYRRQFSQTFNFKQFNQYLIEQAIAPCRRIVAAIDCSFIPKSGKQTYGKDYFFNGCAGKPEKGLEVSVISVVDVDNHLGYTLSVEQTPPQEKPKTSPSLRDDEKLNSAQLSGKAATKRQKLSPGKKSKKSPKRQHQHSQEPEKTRIDFYLEQLKTAQSYLPKSVRYLVADGNYSSYKFVSGVVALDLNQIGKLRIDADLRYLYTGPQKTRGARRKYDGKVKLSDVSRLTLVREVESKIYLYTDEVLHVSLKRNIRIAYLVDCRNPHKIGYALLFSTDTQLDPFSLYCYYKARFQIEFIFRDAKQFTGLTDCQARDQKKLDFHFNASLTALNLAKLDLIQRHSSTNPFVFSMASYKRLALNEHLLETFISKFDLEPTLIKNHPNYEELRSYGAIAA